MRTITATSPITGKVFTKRSDVDYTHATIWHDVDVAGRCGVSRWSRTLEGATKQKTRQEYLDRKDGMVCGEYTIVPVVVVTEA